MRLNHQARAIKKLCSAHDDSVIDMADTDGERSLSCLKEGKCLFVVGHGSRAYPNLSGLTPAELYNLLIANGLPNYLKRLTLFLVCCHAGHKPSKHEQSFAESFYELLIEDINPLEQQHRLIEGSLPKVIAPKHVIKLTHTDPGFKGLPAEHYDECEVVRKTRPEDLEQWLSVHAKPLTSEDLQYTEAPVL